MTASTEYWPVYKGASFDLWTPDTGKHYASVNRAKICSHLFDKRLRQSRRIRSPFHRFPPDWLSDPETLPCRHARIAFRDITNATNTRTVICALIPPGRVIQHSAPYLVFRGAREDEAYLLGVMSSIPFDWCARRFVELHLTFTIFERLPVPEPPADSSLRRRVIEISGCLAACDERFTDWAAEVGVPVGELNDDPERTDAIHELDALVAHLFDLTEDDLVHIFETFQRGWNYRERLDSVLRHYHNWAAVAGAESRSGAPASDEESGNVQ